MNIVVALGQTTVAVKKRSEHAQVQTHAMETLGPITWLYYRGWPVNTGPNTCYGNFGAR